MMWTIFQSRLIASLNQYFPIIPIVSYLQAAQEYGSDYTNLVTFGESGAYLSVLQITGGDLKDLDFGAWKMSGLEIEVSINGEMGKTIYHYNPITNKITSGLWTFSKAG